MGVSLSLLTIRECFNYENSTFSNLRKFTRERFPLYTGADLGGVCLGCCSTPLNPSVNIIAISNSECVYNVGETIDIS